LGPIKGPITGPVSENTETEQVQHPTTDSWEGADDPNINPNVVVPNTDTTLDSVGNQNEDDMTDAQTLSSAGVLPEADEVDLTSDTATNILNEIEKRREALLKQIREYGNAALQGENSLINLAETLVDGAVENVFTTDSGRKVKSDAVIAYETFRNPNAGRKNAPQRVETQSATSFQSNAKKLDNFIKLGQHYRAKGKKFFNDARDVHDAMMRDEQERKSIKLKAVYEAVLHLVRQQLKRGDATTAPIMTADEMRAALRKDESEPKTAIDLLADAYIAMKKAYEGGKADLTRGIDEREALKDPTLKGVMDSLYAFVRDLDAANPGMDIRKSFDEQVLPKRTKKKDDATAQNVATSAPGIPGGPLVRDTSASDVLDEAFDEQIEGEQDTE
jgi:hypothetical protein